MTGESWRRIADFNFDTGAEPGYFAKKLADDNGWRPKYAAQVVDEYRRYLYLACVAGHEVVPSESVDMAWHQHLMDTEAYWDDFCPNVLQKKLHHRPSKGDDSEHHRYYYELTLHTYAATFGSPPPPKVWSSSEDRFGRDLRQRRVALYKHWVVPKLPVRILMAAVVVAVVVGWVGVSSDAQTAGWFVLLVLIGVGGFAWTFVVADRHRRRAEATQDSAARLNDPYEAAMVARGKPGAVNLAVAALVCDNAVAFDEKALTQKKKKYRLVAVGPARATCHEVEQAVYDRIACGSGGVLVSDLHRKRAVSIAALESALFERGLLTRDTMSFWQRLGCAIPAMVGTVAFWCAALVLGVKLVFILAVLAVFAVSTLVIGSRTLSASTSALKALNDSRSRHTRLERIDRHDVRDARELTWIVALQGTGALAGGSFAVLHEALTAPAYLGGGGEKPGGSGCGGGGGCGGCGGCGG